jgi:AcrR family transcriptional regulator
MMAARVGSGADVGAAVGAAADRAEDPPADPAADVEQEPVSRPLRRDAELNLERIVAAAQDVFAESGYEASMERIAQRAGVGVGTLYRRFPNKESLVVAIMEMAGQRSLELVNEVLENAIPAEGIFEFLRRCVSLPASLRALVSRSPHLAETHLAMVESLATPITRLLTNAKAAGSIRTDVTFSDIAIILLSVRAVEDRYEAGAGSSAGGGAGSAGSAGSSVTAKVGRQQGERHLQLLFDGLRTTGSVLPHRPLSRAQLYDLLVRG